MIAEFAGVSAEIKCRFPQNEEFLAAYAGRRAPDILIEPNEGDIENIRREYDIMAQRDGIEVQNYNPVFLERSAIHALLAEKLVDFGVLLMHGSALCFDWQAVIFTAASGTGKSTHARLWREMFGDRVFMINDDKPLLKIEGDCVSVYGTPWDGKHHLSRNTSAPLKAIVSLERAAENNIEPLKKEDAFPVIFRHAYVSEKSEVSAKILQLEGSLLNLASFYRLGCNIDPEAAAVCQKGIFERA